MPIVNPNRNPMNRNKPTVRALILDFGGTIDTNGCHWGKMLWHAYRQANLPIDEQQFRQAYIHAERTLESNPLIAPDYTFGRTLDVKLRLELEQLCIMGALDADEAMLERLRQQIAETLYRQTATTIDRNRRMLTALHTRFPMALVTNFYGNMQQVLSEFRLDYLFEILVESSVVGIRKPDTRIFKAAIAAFGLPPKNILAVGDSFYKDVEPARKLGCQTAWLKGEGWIDKIYDERIPTYILTDLTQLEHIL